MKGIKHGDIVVLGENKKKVVWDYFTNLFEDKSSKIEIVNNGIFNSHIELEEAIKTLSKNKAAGLDMLPGEVYKNNEVKQKLMERLQHKFQNYVRNSDVPHYFMEAKLVLFSKDNTEYPDIEKIRPISILPAITKLFESSIHHNLQKITNSSLFCRNQRGFTKGR
jgi:hypothetical protein